MLRLTPCDCGSQYLVRLNRMAWMRIVPTRRHYFCAKCRDRQFVPRHEMVSWWLPQAPEEGEGRPRQARRAADVPRKAP